MITATQLVEIGNTKMAKDTKEDQNNIIMTGKHWIDGVIWGRVSPLSLSRVCINITYIPASMIEKILIDISAKK